MSCMSDVGSIAALETIPDLDVRLKSIVLQADAAKKKLDAKPDNADNTAKVINRHTTPIHISHTADCRALRHCQTVGRAGGGGAGAGAVAQSRHQVTCAGGAAAVDQGTARARGAVRQCRVAD